MASNYSKVKKICKKHGLKCRMWRVPRSKYSIKCPYSMKPRYLTIHNTGNKAPASNEISYMRSNRSSTSFHWAVDDREAILGVPMNRNAWHAGDGSGTGNRASIGIEICYETGSLSKFKKAEENAAILAAAILDVYNWDISRVKRHKDWSGKQCPGRTMKLGWSRFKNMIRKVYDDYDEYEITKPFTGEMFTMPERGYMQNGHHGTRIKKLQVALNWLTGLGIEEDGWYGDDTEGAVKTFQSNYDLSVDGVFGKKSYTKFKELVEKYGEEDK